MTVSRALSDSASCSASTREQVREVAARLGYRPNPIAKAFVANRQRSQQIHSSMALLVGHLDNNPFKTHDNYRRALAGVKAQAKHMGYSLTPFWIHEPKVSQQRLQNILKARGMKGIILLAMTEREIDLDWQQFSAVTLRSAFQKTRFHAIQTDAFTYSVLAARKLVDAEGYRRPGLILPAQYDKVRQGRISSGYASGLRQAGLDPDGSVLLTRDKKKIKVWLKRYQPDCLLFRYEEQRRVAVELHGAEIPSFAIDRIEGNEHFPGVEQPWRQMGVETVNTLFGALTRQESGFPAMPKRVNLPSSWVSDPDQTLSADETVTLTPT